MNDKINEFLNIPEKLVIGFRKREGTFTGLLSYITYYRGGKIAKEVSWSSWRDSTIDPLEIDNQPVDGFFINKTTAGHKSGWNYRQQYCRVYDPRGFEFEITFDNLIYILQNSSYDINKGFSGKFVYAWDSSQLVLLPIDSDDYIASKKLKEVSEKANIKAKDLVPGKAYKTKKYDVAYYLGNLKWRMQNYSIGKSREIKFTDYHTFLLKAGTISYFPKDAVAGINSMNNILIARDDIAPLSSIEISGYIDKFKKSIYGNTGEATEFRIGQPDSVLQKAWEDIVIKKQKEGIISGAYLKSDKCIEIYDFSVYPEQIYKGNRVVYTGKMTFKRTQKYEIIIDPRTKIIQAVNKNSEYMNVTDEEVSRLVPVSIMYENSTWEVKVGGIWYKGGNYYYINGATGPSPVELI